MLHKRIGMCVCVCVIYCMYLYVQYITYALWDVCVCVCVFVCLCVYKIHTITYVQRRM
jgi:hypothetical protein